MTKGEEEVAFYFQVGNAITEWAFVEVTLRNVMFTCVAPGAVDMNHKARTRGNGTGWRIGAWANSRRNRASDSPWFLGRLQKRTSGATCRRQALWGF